MPSVLLVEDDPIMGESICDRFVLESIDHEWVQSATAALSRMKQRRFDCLISDIRLPDFITGYGTQPQAERLLANGAADYMVKPLDLEHLISKLRLLTTGRAGTVSVNSPPYTGRVSRDSPS
jgi:DNA-binding response OmpR family regulator